MGSGDPRGSRESHKRPQNDQEGTEIPVVLCSGRKWKVKGMRTRVAEKKLESLKSSRELRHPVSTALLLTLGGTIGMGEVLPTPRLGWGLGGQEWWEEGAVFSRKLEEVN